MQHGIIFCVDCERDIATHANGQCDKCFRDLMVAKGYLNFRDYDPDADHDARRELGHLDDPDPDKAREAHVDIKTLR